MNNPCILTDIHEYIALPSHCKDVAVVRGKYGFYHYSVDEFNDKGWGCGYRSLQTLCSWVCYSLNCQRKGTTYNVPSLNEVQNILVKLEDKPSTFIGSREWIGSYEVFLVMDHLYNVGSKILHVPSGTEVLRKAQEILNHFVKFGSPVMIGGDNDASSKTLLGVCCTEQGNYLFLIADPHFVGVADKNTLVDSGWLQWKELKDVFIEGSFYNFCLPQHRKYGFFTWTRRLLPEMGDENWKTVFGNYWVMCGVTGRFDGVDDAALYGWPAKCSNVYQYGLKDYLPNKLVSLKLMMVTARD